MTDKEVVELFYKYRRREIGFEEQVKILQDNGITPEELSRILNKDLVWFVIKRILIALVIGAIIGYCIMV